MSERFSVYHVPGPKTKLYQLGSAILGRDVYDGAALRPPWPEEDYPKCPPHPARAATYGFHATLVAPFRSLVSVETLNSTLQALAAKTEPVALGPLELTILEPGFVALVPKNAPLALNELEERLVKTFTPYAKPIGPDDLARREPLTDRQRALAKKWGYPYVLDQFRFHLTLSDNLADGLPGNAAQNQTPQGQDQKGQKRPDFDKQGFLDLIHALLDESLCAPLPLDSLCLCRQAVTGGPFTVISTALFQKDPKGPNRENGDAISLARDRLDDPARCGLSVNYLHEFK
ncbi:MAG: DUF1045 domain-containing protein [Deltaproteobacteria bacterium]|nr:DUF1045 domain-containing protein [Deltaproteobacteria bacterium]